MWPIRSCLSICVELQNNLLSRQPAVVCHTTIDNYNFTIWKKDKNRHYYKIMILHNNAMAVRNPYVNKKDDKSILND